MDYNIIIIIHAHNTVGVSLKLLGETIPSDSLVDIDDILYTVPSPCCNDDPTNANGLHDQTLVCITDLVDCCDAPRTVHGDWYFPNGRRIRFDTENDIGVVFQANRGPNEVINGRQFYGSVRLYRRYSPTQRGRFYCDLPSAADPNVTQTLYANIGEIILISSIMMNTNIIIAFLSKFWVQYDG